MASFRDRRNPEVTHFPGAIRVRLLIVAALLVDLVCALFTVFLGGSLGVYLFDTAVILCLVTFKLWCWPPEILADQFGLHSVGLFPFRKVRIPWSDIGAVNPGSQVPGFGRTVLGLRNDTLEFHSKYGSSFVAHGPLHSDRDRLLRELRFHGVKVDDSALT